jgi:hypothetical protein
MLKAGFSEVDITPKTRGRLGRLIAEPTQVQGVTWPLFARIALLDDGRQRAALLTLDMNFIFSQNIPEVRAAVADAGGMAPADVLVACSHTHNSFSTTPWHPEEGSDYSGLDYLKGFLPALAREARERLAPCALKAGSVTAPGLTCNRRPMYRDESGKVHVGTQGPDNVDNFVGREGPADDEIKVLFFEDGSGRPMGGLVNCAGHPVTMFGRPVYSSAYIGPMVESLRRTYGCPFGFLYGLSGNVNPAVQGPAEEATQRLGELVARKSVEAIAASRPVADGPLRVSREVIPITLRRVTPQQVAAAKKYQRMNRDEIDLREMCREFYGHDFIFYKASRNYIDVFINETLGTWEFQRRSARRSLVEDVEVQVISIGDMAIVGFATELFCEVKHELQAASPFAHTLFVSLANGGHGYMPNLDSFAHGGYETCIGIASQFVPEAAEMVKDSAARQLRALAGDAPPRRC